VIAVDTNLLVYAHREDSSWHEKAYEVLERLSEGQVPWAIPWPCLHEFLAIVTHPRIYDPPTPLSRALDQVKAWLGSPSLALLSEGAGYWADLEAALKASRSAGPQVHDARIAALCLHHQVAEIWTADRNFGRYPALKVRNPLVR
jgi:toxin-antitoxin system PIN domain toxin